MSLRLIRIFVATRNDSNRARNEGIVVSFVASALFIFNIIACQPTWISTKKQSGAWILQETANVCIDVSTQELPKVIEAIQAWDLAIGKWKRLLPQTSINEFCDYTIKEVDPPLFKNTMALATTSSIPGREIELYRGRYETDTLTVVLHELGHAFGARHIEGTLMAPQLTKFIYRCPDAATIAQIAASNGIDPSLFSWCTHY